MHIIRVDVDYDTINVVACSAVDDVACSAVGDFVWCDFLDCDVYAVL